MDLRLALKRVVIYLADLAFYSIYAHCINYLFAFVESSLALALLDASCVACDRGVDLIIEWAKFRYNMLWLLLKLFYAYKIAMDVLAAPERFRVTRYLEGETASDQQSSSANRHGG
jgi:hypothetical protein